MQNIVIDYDGYILGDGSNHYISHLDLGDVPIRQAMQLAASRDGGFIFNQNYGIRIISFRVNTFSGSDAQFFEDIRAVRRRFARTNEPKLFKVTLWDGSVRQALVYPFQLPNPKHEPGMTDKAENTTFVLQAPYPFLSGSDEDVVTAHLELNESLGFDYPFDYPFDYVAGAVNSEVTIDNDGDVPALVKVVFNGPVDIPTLVNTTTGEIAQIDTSLAGGESVTLEYTTNRGRVIENGSGLSYETHFNGDTAFFFAPVGSNTFVFTAGSYNAAASCDITLTKYFLS